MADVQAVIFDVGDTLWFEARRPPLSEIFALQAERIRPLLAAWGVRLEVRLEEVMSDVWDAAEAAIAHEKDRGQHREIDLPFIIRGAMGIRNAELTDEQARAWHRAAWIGSPQMGMQLYPDTLDVLDGLRARGIALAVNSNRPCTNAIFEAELAETRLAGYFGAVVASGETGHAKPHPSTFQLALSKLDVPAHAAVMVGDSCANDMEGAKALGMQTVLKLNGRYDAPACGAADYTIHDLAELLALPLFGEARAVAESLTPHEDANADRY